jgi:putative FmdB family regulatory protein
MPLYDYTCDCGWKEEQFVFSQNEVVSCPRCGAIAQRQFPTTVHAHVFPNEGIHLKNVSSKGETFFSKAEMRAYERSHKVELGALL